MINKSIDTIEKVFRYLVPGFVFIALYKLYYPEMSIPFLSKNYTFDFYIYLPCLGILIYAIHRLFFELVDLLIYIIIGLLYIIKNGIHRAKSIEEYYYELTLFKNKQILK